MSSSTQEVVLFVFRRDYRLKDNLALHECMNYSRKKKYDILPVFIIDTNQVNGSYFSSNSFQFLAESLDDLDNSLDKKLVIFKSILRCCSANRLPICSAAWVCLRPC